MRIKYVVWCLVALLGIATSGAFIVFLASPAGKSFLRWVNWSMYRAYKMLEHPVLMIKE